MTEEQRFIEAPFAKADTPWEWEAAAQAQDRIRARLSQQQQIDPPVELSFKIHDR